MPSPRITWVSYGTARRMVSVNYDGYTFKTFRHDPDDKGSLHENFIESLFVDSEGTLWIGIQDGWLDRFDRNGESFTHYALSEHVYAITEDQEGYLWLGSLNPGLLRFNPETGEAETIWQASEVRGVDVDSKGRNWAASADHGLWRLDTVTGEVDEFPNDISILDIASALDGRIWMATLGGGNCSMMLVRKNHKDRSLLQK